jgi:DNA-binding NtrC family response regulator
MEARNEKTEVLIVEDDRGARKAIESLLKGEYKVWMAANSAEAFDRLNASPVSVVLLDIGLPDLDGREVLRRIKAAWPRVEVIMVSATKDMDAVVDCFEDGAFDFIVKPYRPEVVISQVRQAVERMELRMSVQALTAKLVERQPSIVSVFGQFLRRLDEGTMDLPELTAQVEKMLIERALRRFDGDKRQASANLGISEAALTSAMAVLGVSTTRKK